ncbi:hypothetical protein SAMD00019534_110880 [Acytostelium subglobosum LB1]|uniref:hypothetical protein n=1 Tax=Acytostelium subglobosum LB1 TaxID=1410327 RepID=UPI000644F944|nr:hypothetical protein SAMD00019534_110880 [Acytostelium subglobosum LB1]GAM27912.1 hypothetical protein SAMD00019534_110880 [Acytostelium subglobosum LB1]|eukprot:XP_012749195.1 hypothetical protein SAMD00019534_110880 [Acytostelium subglobosum LB1]
MKTAAGKLATAVWISSAGLVIALLVFNITPSLLNGLPWFHITLGFNSFIFFLELYLDIRQSFTIRQYRNPKASWTTASFHIENILGLLNFRRTESTIGFVLECCILNFGALVYLYSLNNTMWEYYGFGEQYEVTRGISYLLMVSMFSSLIRLPFELYRVFLVDKRPDSPGHADDEFWLRQIVLDQVKMFLVSLIIGTPLLAFTIALFTWQFPYQWLYIIIFASTVSLFFSDMYPTFAIMFNSFAVVGQGELRDEIVNLSKKLSFPVKQIYTMDGSKRVSHSNAFLLGFWNNSIVLYDTLLKQLTTQEILAIIGHEIGHYRYKHSWKHLFVQLMFLGNFIFLFSRVVNLDMFYSSFGFPKVDVTVGLVLFSYLYSTFANLLRFVTNLIRREFEYAADRYALGNGLDMKNALLSMHGKGRYIKPDIYFSLYYYSHPTLMERLDSIEAITNDLNVQHKKDT